MRPKLWLIALIYALFLITACNASHPANNSTTPLPTPASGKATVTGRVLSLESKPLPRTAVWLAEVVCDGPDPSRCAFVLDAAHSPGVYTDEEGYFVITNVDPKKYVVTIGDPQSVYDNIPDDSGRPEVFDIPADKVTDLGELKANLPLP
jgi:hypothetical protein